MDLNQITIPSLDVEKATEFYKTLGLHLIVDAAPRYVRFECPDGNSTFSIHKVDAMPQGNGITIYFEDDNLDDLVTNLQKKGIRFTQLPEDQTYLWREARLQDLDGNNIILFHAGENRKNPPWRVNS
ncbi:VOC family protein [Flavivirga eckloniae]|uniref:Glyoxalase/bleomycin resistance/extradiol dioxygenase family protein n=1 Tax=Flavivirga eckloniae TaxID=1803846 RepID=A0A2K9PVB0_9FLAO|nr:VOC family protein [Flavivirga eckloniae]AUP81005.1 glyoxalase/bleomycin resistance/extradiol dioxygenase family protein [Flavivirga eckloniae]